LYLYPIVQEVKFLADRCLSIEYSVFITLNYAMRMDCRRSPTAAMRQNLREQMIVEYGKGEKAHWGFRYFLDFAADFLAEKFLVAIHSNTLQGRRELLF
jgi:hypothetical protein